MRDELIRLAILAGLAYLALKLFKVAFHELKRLKKQKDLKFANLDAAEGILLYWEERRKQEPNMIRSMSIYKELNILSMLTQQSNSVEEFEEKLKLSEISYMYEKYIIAKELKLGKTKYVAHLKFNH